jgi:hypothetical protein
VKQILKPVKSIRIQPDEVASDNCDDLIVVQCSETKVHELIYILESIQTVRRKLEKSHSKDDFEALLDLYRLIGSQVDAYIFALSTDSSIKQVA